MSREKFNRRLKTLETDTTRVDYFSYLARDKNSNFTGMSNIELGTNCILLMIAGSESMPSALGATAYYLTRMSIERMSKKYGERF